MALMNFTNARKNLYKLMEVVNNSSNSVTITNSKGGNAVLIFVLGLIESILDADKQDSKKMRKYNPTEER